MSVRIENFNVLVPAQRIVEAYPGGLAAYERRAPNLTYDCDGELTGIAFPSDLEANIFAYDLEKLGLRMDAPYDTDIVIVDADIGDTASCPWIELETDESMRVVAASLVESELPGPPDPWEA